MKVIKNCIIVILAIIASFEAGLIVSYGFVTKAMNEAKTSYRRPISYANYYRRESGDE